ncbi:hypothetical protein C8J57DRAFT_1579437 [Mycena rebaudengoi]|nr:hypothetical protein C8J57DRAFT_1579437 [Mycena rebaudengoi]
MPKAEADGHSMMEAIDNPDDELTLERSQIDPSRKWEEGPSSEDKEEVRLQSQMEGGFTEFWLHHRDEAVTAHEHIAAIEQREHHTKATNTEMSRFEEQDREAAHWECDTDDLEDMEMGYGWADTTTDRGSPHVPTPDPNTGGASPTSCKVAEPQPEDECILHSVVMTSTIDTDQYLTFVDHCSTLYVRCVPLPHYHYLNPEFREAHEAALAEAISHHASELGCSPSDICDAITWEEKPLASSGPDDNNKDWPPGFRAHFLSQQIEHRASVIRPEIDVSQPPSCKCKDIACLTAQLEIGGVKAYMLFDSGSNTDSLTPEFAVPPSSKSKISYGTRAPVNFGGIHGTSYFDQVNLDHYDGIIGTPFMNKHGLILDFGQREVWFPNNQSIPAMILESLTRRRRAEVMDTVDEDDEPCGPFLPADYPYLLELESLFADDVTLEYKLPGLEMDDGSDYTSEDGSSLEDEHADDFLEWTDNLSIYGRDLMGPIPLELPPMWAINHQIHLINEKAVYNFHMPQCPKALRPLLKLKMEQYITAGWWEMSSASQAAPLLCLPKKDSSLRMPCSASDVGRKVEAGVLSMSMLWMEDNKNNKDVDPKEVKK